MSAKKQTKSSKLSTKKKVAKKQNKLSKKPTTKVKDLPESVQWLLDFSNLGCKPGVFSLKRFHENEELRINCPPEEPAAPKFFFDDSTKKEEPLTTDSVHHIEELLEREFKHLALEEYKGIYLKRFRDENGNEWVKTRNGELLFRGNENDFPSEEEIKDFLRERGIDLPQNQTGQLPNGDFVQFIQRGSSGKKINTTFWDINKVWFCAKYSLTAKMKGFEGTYHIPGAYSKGFVHNCYDFGQIVQPDVDVANHYGVKYLHDNTFIQTTCAFIQDFWNNHRELHSRLRQCQCCGKFEFVLSGKYTYCSTKCRQTFNRKAREADKALKTSSRKKIKEVIIPIVKEEIKNYLRNEYGYTEKEAEAEYEKWHSKYPPSTTSLKSFKSFFLRGYN
ncbi:MAG: hypothetical protein NUV86_08170 [Candidatus Scalindua sp.]|nr:hypothetical protein [Candidatus Scalindua sp.]